MGTIDAGTPLLDEYTSTYLVINFLYQSDGPGKNGRKNSAAIECQHAIPQSVLDAAGRKATDTKSTHQQRGKEKIQSKTSRTPDSTAEDAMFFFF
jgi:hypothetical protein